MARHYATTRLLTRLVGLLGRPSTNSSNVSIRTRLRHRHTLVVDARPVAPIALLDQAWPLFRPPEDDSAMQRVVGGYAQHDVGDIVRPQQLGWDAARQTFGGRQGLPVREGATGPDPSWRETVDANPVRRRKGRQAGGQSNHARLRNVVARKTARGSTAVPKSR